MVTGSGRGVGVAGVSDICECMEVLLSFEPL